MKRPKLMVDLYLESSSDYRITQVDGTDRQTISAERAKELFRQGSVRNYNLSFSRLIQFDFDVEKVKAYYAGHRRSV